MLYGRSTFRRIVEKKVHVYMNYINILVIIVCKKSVGIKYEFKVISLITIQFNYSNI